MNNNPAGLKVIAKKAKQVLAKLRHYSFVLFLVFVIGLYGFVFMKIQSLSTAEPTDEAISSQVKAAKVPHIDERVIKQLESLQDNSVSVKALFDEARNNPFQFQ